MSRLVIVPLDRSSFAEQALPHAAAIANGLGAAVELVLVHQPVLPLGADPGLLPSLDAEVQASEERYLAAAAERIAADARIAASTTVLVGPVAATLAKHIESRNPDVVVMTTHGRGGAGRFFLGSVADRLIRLLHQPIFLVRPRSRRPAASIPAAPSREPLRVVLPLDGSAHAEKTIDRVLALFPDRPVELELLRVVSPEGGGLVPPAAMPAPLGGASLPERLHQANGYLHAVAVRLRERGIRTHAQVVTAMRIPTAILRYAQDRGAGLVAIATHGRSGVDRLLLGSVADKVIRACPTPVLVWNPPSNED